MENTERSRTDWLAVVMVASMLFGFALLFYGILVMLGKPGPVQLLSGETLTGYFHYFDKFILLLAGFALSYGPIQHYWAFSLSGKQAALQLMMFGVLCLLSIPLHLWYLRLKSLT